MKAELITDLTGEPLRVTMPYQDWLEMAQTYHIPPETVVQVPERNPLDWYDRTESLNSILNGLIALTSRERLKEIQKTEPDQQRVSELTALRDEVWAVNKHTPNFKSLERMEELIAHYSPVLLAEKKKIQA